MADDVAMAAVDWLVVAGYGAIVALIGWWASRRGDNTDTGYFLGGRSLPVWAVAASLLATSLSAVTFIGAPQDAYGGDLSYLILNLGTVLGAVLVATLILPVLYRAGVVTVYEYFGQRFGAGASVAGGAAFVGGRLLASGARLLAAGVAVALLLGWGADRQGLVAAVLIVGAAGTLYTLAGGIRAVVWTDTLQIVVVVGAAGLSVILLLRGLDMGVGEAWSQLEAAGKTRWFSADPSIREPYTVWTALAMTLFIAAAYGTDQDLTQRLLTCRSAGRAAWSLLGGVLVGLPVTGLFMGIGLLLWLRDGGASAAGGAADVYPRYLLEGLPTGVRGLAVAGLLAAAMSSLDSACAAIGSSLRIDLRLGLGNRVSVLVAGAALTATAAGAAATYDPQSQSLLAFALGVMTFAYGGLLGVMLTAILTRRGSVASVITALVTGAVVVAALRWLSAWTGVLGLGDGAGLTPPAFAWWMVAATAASFAVCAAVPGPARGTGQV